MVLQTSYQIGKINKRRQLLFLLFGVRLVSSDKTKMLLWFPGCLQQLPYFCNGLAVHHVQLLLFSLRLGLIIIDLSHQLTAQLGSILVIVIPLRGLLLLLSPLLLHFYYYCFVNYCYYYQIFYCCYKQLQPCINSIIPCFVNSFNVCCYTNSKIYCLV